MRPAPIWLFDLDNTLHHASPHIFPHINRAMTAYLMTHLGLDEPAANQLRLDYWQRYGATLTGLMRHHRTDAEHFLWHTHQFPDLASQLVRVPVLRHVLRQLPGRKIVFSNGPRAYVAQVVAALGLEQLFEDQWSIQRMRLRPKPDPVAFRQLLHHQRVPAGRCIMVEDSLENLLTAKRLGMRTVWVTTSLRRSPAVDVRIRSVTQLAAHYPRCWAG